MKGYFFERLLFVDSISCTDIVIFRSLFLFVLVLRDFSSHIIDPFYLFSLFILFCHYSSNAHGLNSADPFVTYDIGNVCLLSFLLVSLTRTLSIVLIFQFH